MMSVTDSTHNIVTTLPHQGDVKPGYAMCKAEPQPIRNARTPVCVLPSLQVWKVEDGQSNKREILKLNFPEAITPYFL